MIKITKVTISLVSLAILLATLTNVPVSSASYTTTKIIASSGMVLQPVLTVNALVHKALLSWGGLPSGDVGFAAKFDWLYMSSETYQLIPTIRAVNPNITIIGYLDVTVGNPSINYPETCYMHNTTGSRLYFSSGDPFMNVSDPTWQIICASNATALLTKGFDGVMADDTWSNFFTGMYGLTSDPAPSANWWNNYANGAQYTRWQTAMRTLLAGMQAAVGNKIIICNGGDMEYYNVCSGVNLENFCFGGGAQPLDWISDEETISAAGKIVVAEPHNAMADNETNYIYGLSCYMLGMNGSNTYFCWASIWYPSMGIYPSIINQDFGNPLGNRVQVSANVWTREFTNCTVTVDFSNQTGQIVMK
jgi:hypothetical protein